MEINKQLFEDILSGKLKGEFLLKSGVRIKSDKLTITANPYFRYHLQGPFGYTETGRVDPEKVDIKFTLVDFIPENVMDEYELDVKIPVDKQIDWDESKKRNKIVLIDNQDKQLTYKDICEKLFKNKDIFYTVTDGVIHSDPYSEIKDCVCHKNNAASKHQLECLLAKNMLANVAMYLNDGWKPSKTDLGHFDAWIIYVTPKKDYMACVKIDSCAANSNVLFKSEELAEKAIEILGEETVKLALEPLGI